MKFCPFTATIMIFMVCHLLFQAFNAFDIYLKILKQHQVNMPSGLQCFFSGWLDPIQFRKKIYYEKLTKWKFEKSLSEYRRKAENNLQRNVVKIALEHNFYLEMNLFNYLNPKFNPGVRIQLILRAICVLLGSIQQRSFKKRETPMKILGKCRWNKRYTNTNYE